MEDYKKYKQKIEEWFDGNRIGISLVLSLLIIFSASFVIIKNAEASKDSNSIKSTDIVLDKEEEKEEEGLELKNEVVFDIEGAVKNPGVYRLAQGSVLVDAINIAGGFSIDVDRERVAKEINQASVIGNNSKIYIFRNKDKNVKVVSIGSPSPAYLNSSSESSQNESSSNKTNSKININNTSASELDVLPGVGPAIAQRIIDWREVNGGFEVIEDIKKVKGIGDAMYEKIKDQISVE